ncbi:MAG: hypothetical protein KGJ80_18415 [Chloroflexota bacterium]|nr:hypothetical protein [Chloroflexota bacterium]
MITVTLQVPNELARRLNLERDRLPQILEWALNQFPARSVSFPATAPALAFTEMVEFLSSHPANEQILAFKISPHAQARLDELLDKNREEGLSDTENAELDWYEYVHDIMIRLKAQARPAPTT